MVYPTEIVRLTISVATAFNWVANFPLALFALPGFQHIQWKVSGYLISRIRQITRSLRNLGYIKYSYILPCSLATLIHVFLLFQETYRKLFEII